MQDIKILKVTKTALDKAQALIAAGDNDILGIRIKIKQGGCSGQKYFIEYAREVEKFDEVVELSGVKILIDPKALMYLIGSEMDYIEDKFKSGFTFSNPNEKARCGCGQSFSL